MAVQAVQIASRAVQAAQTPFAFLKIDQGHRWRVGGILTRQPAGMDHDVFGVQTVVFKMQPMQLPDQGCYRAKYTLTLARIRPAAALPFGRQVFECPVTSQFACHQNAAQVRAGIVRGKQHRLRHSDAGRLAAHQDAKLALAGEPTAQWMAHAAVDVVLLALDEHPGIRRQAVPAHRTPAAAAAIAGFHLVQAQCPPGLELVKACRGKG